MFHDICWCESWICYIWKFGFVRFYEIPSSRSTSINGYSFTKCLIILPSWSGKNGIDDFSFSVVDSKDKKGKKDEKKKEKEKEKEKEKVKLYTALPELLLSFVYFDQNHTGYLLDKDVEEILHTLGLQLSRAQVL